MTVRRLFALALLLAAGGCVQGATTEGGIGNDPVRPMLLSGLGLMSLPDLQPHLEAIAGRLSAQLPGHPPAPAIYLVPSPDFVAESGPNGGIFLSHGTLTLLHSDDALAFVIGHEIGHVELGHFATRTRAQGWAHALEVLAIGSVRIATHSRLQPTALSDLRQPAMRAVVVAGGLREVADGVMFPSWSRDQERAADAYGLDLMVRAGYSPAGADEVFDRLEAEEKARDDKLAAAAAAAQAAEQANTDALVRKGDLSGLLNEAVNGAMRHAQADVGGLFNADNTHGSAKERHNLVAALIDSKYADTSPVAGGASWTGTLATPGTASRLAAYETQEDADDAFYSGRGAVAVMLIRRIDASPIAQEPRPANLRAHLLTASGHPDQAIATLIPLMTRQDVLLDSYQQLIDLELGARRVPQAVAAMRIARGVLGDPKELYPADLRVLRAANLQGEKLAVLTQCYLVGDDDLSQQCKTAAGA